MKHIEHTLSTPEANLALDEALLEACDAGEGPEVLRFWESDRPFVVLGCANRALAEVDLDACAREGIPILRRTSGGGAVLQGPGCLNYSLILRVPESGPFAQITGTNAAITAAHAEALQPVAGPELAARGLSDLALGDLKISGNAQRRKRRAFLFHGTFLLDFDLGRIERCLRMPLRQPDYRRGRPHREFVANLAAAREAVKARLRACWSADEELGEIPEARADEIARDLFASRQWTMKF